MLCVCVFKGVWVRVKCGPLGVATHQFIHLNPRAPFIVFYEDNNKHDDRAGDSSSAVAGQQGKRKRTKNTSVFRVGHPLVESLTHSTRRTPYANARVCGVVHSCNVSNVRNTSDVVTLELSNVLETAKRRGSFFGGSSSSASSIQEDYPDVTLPPYMDVMEEGVQGLWKLEVVFPSSLDASNWCERAGKWMSEWTVSPSALIPTSGDDPANALTDDKVH